mgnify:CR=1 FL=1
MHAKKVSITLDLDWIHDDISEWVINWVESENVPVTVFATHLSPAVSKMRESAYFEVGIHPNFNDLLSGVSSNETTYDRIKLLKDLIPEATSVRSHSLTQSSRILDMFSEFGFTHEVNTFIPATCDQILKPWYHCDSNMLRLPYIFDDSLASRIEGLWDVDKLISPPLSILNFHFGRLFINAYSDIIADDALAVRRCPEKFSKFRRPVSETGSFNLLNKLKQLRDEKTLSFEHISEITI